MLEKMRYGYARISDDDQNLDRQQRALSAYGCDTVVQEIESGVKARRRLDALLERLVPGDELVTIDIDRLGRGTADVILLMDELIKRDVVFRILSMPSLDIRTEDGRLVADIVAVLAAHERRRLRRRQAEGIAAARFVGRHLGRRQKMNGQQIAEARTRLAADEAPSIVARAYGVTARTLRNTLKRTGSAA